MNTLELVLGQLVQEKNILEYDLEKIVNSDNIDTLEKINRSKDILSKISNIITMINLTSNYLQPKNNEVMNNNN